MSCLIIRWERLWPQRISTHGTNSSHRWGSCTKGANGHVIWWIKNQDKTQEITLMQVRMTFSAKEPQQSLTWKSQTISISSYSSVRVFFSLLVRPNRPILPAEKVSETLKCLDLALWLPEIVDHYRMDLETHLLAKRGMDPEWSISIPDFLAINLSSSPDHLVRIQSNHRLATKSSKLKNARSARG